MRANGKHFLKLNKFQLFGRLYRTHKHVSNIHVKILLKLILCTLVTIFVLDIFFVFLSIYEIWNNSLLVVRSTNNNFHKKNFMDHYFSSGLIPTENTSGIFTRVRNTDPIIHINCLMIILKHTHTHKHIYIYIYMKVKKYA